LGLVKRAWLQALPPHLRSQAEADLAADDAKVTWLEVKIRVLEEALRLRRLERYGRRSESLTEEQLLLLSTEPTVSAQELAAEAERAAAAKKNSQADAPARVPRRKHPGRAPLPAHLPRQEQVIPCPPAQQDCPICHQPTVVIGYDTSEELCVKPAEYFVRVIRREKRACRQHPEGGVATAPAPAKLLPKSKLSDAVIIDTVIRKYTWHQPLYRQAAMLAQEAQVVIDRHTLNDGVMSVGELLLPLKPPMRQELFSRHYLQADETTVGVKTPRVRGRSHRAYLFEYSQPHGVAVFDFRMGRGREGPREFLQGFVGTLQCDGYAGYDDLAPPGSPAAAALCRAGCLAHARRYFDKAHEVAPTETAALGVVRQIGALYAVEAQARDQGLAAAERLALRQQQSVPLMAALKAQIEKLQTTALPKSALGRACRYALGQWPRLEVFLRDGQVEIDNNLCENGMRPVALGRKNWLLIGSEAAGPKVAAILSVLETCRRLKIDARAYLHDVLPRLAQWPLPNVAELTPQAWQQRQPPKSA
jgi:transposase